MKVLLSILALTPTWYDYAKYNSMYTAFYYNYYKANIECLYPGEDGKSLCIGKEDKTVLIMSCRVDRYSLCNAWEKEVK